VFDLMVNMLEERLSTLPTNISLYKYHLNSMGGKHLFCKGLPLKCTRNFLTFANTTAIAYRKNLEAPDNFSPICNNSCVCKRQKITSIILVPLLLRHYLCTVPPFYACPLYKCHRKSECTRGILHQKRPFSPTYSTTNN